MNAEDLLGKDKKDFFAACKILQRLQTKHNQDIYSLICDSGFMFTVNFVKLGKPTTITDTKPTPKKRKKAYKEYFKG